MVISKVDSKKQYSLMMFSEAKGFLVEEEWEMWGTTVLSLLPTPLENPVHIHRLMSVNSLVDQCTLTSVWLAFPKFTEARTLSLLTPISIHGLCFGKCWNNSVPQHWTYDVSEFTFHVGLLSTCPHPSDGSLCTIWMANGQRLTDGEISAWPSPSGFCGQLFPSSRIPYTPPLHVLLCIKEGSF